MYFAPTDGSLSTSAHLYENVTDTGAGIAVLNANAATTPFAHFKITVTGTYDSFSAEFDIYGYDGLWAIPVSSVELDETAVTM